MNHSTPSLPVHHWLPEFTQTQVHRVGDAIQPSHPLSIQLVIQCFCSRDNNCCNKLTKVYSFYYSLKSPCEELTHWKRLMLGWIEGRSEGDDRGWDGWMASLTRWTWVWVNSGSWWWTGRPGMLRFMGLQRVRHDWATELNWTPIV